MLLSQPSIEPVLRLKPKLPGLISKFPHHLATMAYFFSLTSYHSPTSCSTVLTKLTCSKSPKYTMCTHPQDFACMFLSVWNNLPLPHLSHTLPVSLKSDVTLFIKLSWPSRDSSHLHRYNPWSLQQANQCFRFKTLSCKSAFYSG